MLFNEIKRTVTECDSRPKDFECYCNTVAGALGLLIKALKHICAPP